MLKHNTLIQTDRSGKASEQVIFVLRASVQVGVSHVKTRKRTFQAEPTAREMTECSVWLEGTGPKSGACK